MANLSSYAPAVDIGPAPSTAAWDEVTRCRTLPASTATLSDSPGTGPTPRTSPRKCSFGCTATSPATHPERLRAGCTASPPSFLDLIRRRRRIHLYPLTDSIHRPGDSTPEQELDARTLQPEPKSALKALNPGFLAVNLLHDLDGYTYDEIGLMPGIPPGTVASRLRRARAQVRGTLARTSGA